MSVKITVRPRRCLSERYTHGLALVMQRWGGRVVETMAVLTAAPVLVVAFATDGNATGFLADYDKLNNDFT